MTKLGFEEFMKRYGITTRDDDILGCTLFKRRNMILPIPYSQMILYSEANILSILIEKMGINDDPTRYV